MSADIRNRVAKGAALLDKHNPNWFRDIDLEVLDQDWAGTCVLGQLYGYWGTGLARLFGTDDADDAIHVSNEHGFGRDENFPGLTEEWERVIEQRGVDWSTLASDTDTDTDTLSVDDFIKEHGAKLEQMYVNRTAGDYSFTGFVAAVLLDLQTRKGVQIF